MEARAALARLVGGGTLDEGEAEALFERVLNGELDEAQIGALLALVQSRGATADELTGGARVMRRHVTPVPTPTGPGIVVVDTCGTGGAPKTFNVSTAAALVAAGASPHHEGGSVRVLVAKHGNRSRTGRGSSEVLAALGVNVDADPSVQRACLEEAGVCFCFAIHHHPAMRHVAGPRKSLGMPTIFNLLGPLTNPARANRQVIGVYAAELVPLLAEVLRRLGATSALVAHGAGGLDELSTLGVTECGVVEGGAVRSERVDAAGLGLRCASRGALEARDVEDSARLVREAIGGSLGAARDIVVLNAAAALRVAGAARDMAEGVSMASRAIDAGRAREALDRLVRTSGG